MSKNGKTKKAENKAAESKSSLSMRLFGWAFRMFNGASKDIDRFAVEEIVSPGKAVLKEFMSRKLAVVSLIVVILIFLVVIIGPFFNPIDLSYTEVDQKNTPPGMSLLSVPSALDGNCKQIAVGSTYSVGLSNEGEVYIWGNTKITKKINLKDIPDEVKNNEIVMVAAGSDHVIAIDSNGKVHGWGNSNNAQYGSNGRSVATELIYTYAPEEITNGTLDVTQIKQLTCGYQVTAIVMNDGHVYMWGNHNNGATNMKSICERTDIDKITFCNNAAVALLKDGTVFTGEYTAFDYISITASGEASETSDVVPETAAEPAADGEPTEATPVPATSDRQIIGGKYQISLEEYINGRRVTDIGASKNTLGIILEDGEIFVTGTALYGEKDVPELKSDEKPISIYGGSKHFTMLTDKGNVYSWGSNLFKQSKVPANVKDVEQISAGAFQSYAINGEGEIYKWGHKGYLMGTDDLGRDIWNRILNGGRMTMTIGAIAVIISSIIGIIIGCLSGYFGGVVDMVLMRITEIFSAIPFLPFALMLSVVVQQTEMTEDMRIGLIMVILGLLSWTGLARLVRAQVLAEREKEFVTAAQAMGVKETRIAFKHILPNIISVILVTMTLDFAGCMLTESSLSYLGFGVKLPRPTWGNMLYGSNNSIVIQQYWWRWVFPALFLGICTICINIVGDTLRDVMDPKSNER